MKRIVKSALIGKHLFDNFLFQSGPKQKDALSPLLINLSLQYDVRKAQRNQVEQK
jgi:hypothetical protein